MVRYTDGTLDVPGAPTIVTTPGHTLGPCSLQLAERDAVIAGDALVMLDPYTATGAGTVLTGHGPVWREGAERAVQLAWGAGPA